jgi:hypothetical protein
VRLPADIPPLTTFTAGAPKSSSSCFALSFYIQRDLGELAVVASATILLKFAQGSAGSFSFFDLAKMTCFSFFLELLKAVLLKKDKTNDSTPPPQHSLQPPTSYSGAVASHTPTSKPSYSAAASHSTPASGPSSHDDAPPTSTYSKPLPGPASGVEKALEEIWNLDENRFIPGKDFTLDLQSYTFVSHMEDKSFRYHFYFL